MVRVSRRQEERGQSTPGTATVPEKGSKRGPRADWLVVFVKGGNPGRLRHPFLTPVGGARSGIAPRAPDTDFRLFAPGIGLPRVCYPGSGRSDARA